MKNIEQTIVELGSIYQQLAHMVQEQGEMVQRYYTLSSLLILPCNTLLNCFSIRFFHNVIHYYDSSGLQKLGELSGMGSIRGWFYRCKGVFLLLDVWKPYL